MPGGLFILSTWLDMLRSTQDRLLFLDDYKSGHSTVTSRDLLKSYAEYLELLKYNMALKKSYK